MRAARPASLVTVAAAAALIVAGCGNGGDEKPGYCSDLKTLQSSITDVKSLVSSGDFSGLKTQATTIKTNAEALVESAKSDFPSETTAITSSIDTLESAAKALPSNPSASQLATLGTDALNVVTSVQDFASATQSKCD